MTTFRSIVLTGGGTAGHIMPCVALIERLRPHFTHIHYIGSSGGMESRIIGTIPDVIYHAVPCVKLDRSKLLSNINIPYKLHTGVKAAKKLLDVIQPDVIFSKGGYVSLPVVLASHNIPVVMHESDITMGLANRLVKRRCRIIATAFDGTAKGDNVYRIGIPLRSNLYVPKVHSSRPTLLVIGGSLGSRTVSRAIMNQLDDLLRIYDIIHIVGKGNLSDTKRNGYREIEFTDNMSDLYSRADVAVSRGGATTLFELIALRIPALVIPLPKGVSRGDQVLNAKYFAERKLCHVLYESELEHTNLTSCLNKLLADKELAAALKNARDMDGTGKLTRIILDTADSKRRQSTI